METSEFLIEPGFPESGRDCVARLFWQAFHAKLHLLLRPEARAVSFIAGVLNPDFAMTALDRSGRVIGVAGFKTGDGALVGGGVGDLARHYGWFGALWRGLCLELLERDTEDRVLLMDGIFVDTSARGKGVGTALLRAIVAEASRRGLDSVRLDVIDTNPRARALYEREGFVAGDTHHLGPLKHLFGFDSATTLIRSLS